jgi:hypothetical protein
LNQVAEKLWSTADPQALQNLLQVFSRRGLPEFDFRLIGLCRHPDVAVRRWALRVMEETSHPQVREFALSELEPESQTVFTTGRSVVGLFVKNACSIEWSFRKIPSSDMAS